nr:hypothetical protein [Tanacetum cinerariifolium]
MVINSPYCSNKELASPKANGSCNEALTIPGQTPTGKENSNPLMAASLPKTILLSFIHEICINMSPFEFSLVYLVITNVQIINVVSSKLMLFGLANAAVHLMLLGFDQIVDFLTAHTIQYALMVNPTIYVSCIKQFWALVSIKKSNDAVKLQALIDRKKVI